MSFEASKIRGKRGKSNKKCCFFSLLRLITEYEASWKARKGNQQMQRQGMLTDLVRRIPLHRTIHTTPFPHRGFLKSR